jgi:hypothetical protein
VEVKKTSKWSKNEYSGEKEREACHAAEAFQNSRHSQGNPSRGRTWDYLGDNPTSYMHIHFKIHKIWIYKLLLSHIFSIRLQL